MHCITPVKNENQLGVYGKMKKKKVGNYLQPRGLLREKKAKKKITLLVDPRSTF